MTSTVGGRVRMSTVGFDLLWERLGLGAYPLVFPLLSHGATDLERVRLLDAARAELLADGVLEGPDVTPRVAAWLRTLAAPAEEVHVRRVATTGVLRASVVRGPDATGPATAPDVCVRAVLADGTVTLTPVHPGGVAAAAVALLPEAPAGDGGQLSAPSAALAEAFAAGQDGPDGFTVVARRLGATREDATTLARALATTGASTQLGVAMTRDGQRTAHPHVVLVHDTEAGRYVLTERPAPDGTPWATLRPATPAQVTRAVAELLTDARG
ncbi:ESX secretion-associated protein EspG [Rhodococcus aerolatus]